MNLHDKVAALLQEVAEEHILPRFRSLSADEVEEKGPGDLVTEADRRAEAALAPRLAALLPGSLTVGEEAASANLGVLERMNGDEPLWVIDPVDGTRNFVDGSNEFASMVALVAGGETAGAWIWFPALHILVSAEKGAGAWRREAGRGAARLQAGKSGALDEMHGAISTSFMPEPWKERMLGFGKRAGNLHSHFCAACEYRDIAAGTKDFAAFYRMLPWDHAPGALILTEAGGVVRSLETGKDYGPRIMQGPHVLARSGRSWELIAAAVREASV